MESFFFYVVAIDCQNEGEPEAFGDGVCEGAGEGFSAPVNRAGWGQWRPSIKEGTVCVVQHIAVVLSHKYSGWDQYLTQVSSLYMNHFQAKTKKTATLVWAVDTVTIFMWPLLCEPAGTPEVSESADISRGRAASSEGDERGAEEMQHAVGTGKAQGRDLNTHTHTLWISSMLLMIPNPWPRKSCQNIRSHKKKKKHKRKAALLVLQHVRETLQGVKAARLRMKEILS